MESRVCGGQAAAAGPELLTLMEGPEKTRVCWCLSRLLLPRSLEWDVVGLYLTRLPNDPEAVAYARTPPVRRRYRHPRRSREASEQAQRYEDPRCSR